MDGATKTAYDISPLALNRDVVGVADLTGDGKADIVLRNTDTGYLYMWAMDGSLKTYFGISPLPLNRQVVGLADLTADGKADIVLRNQDTGYLYMWAMDGNLKTYYGISSLALNRMVVGMADLTGDGVAAVALNDSGIDWCADGDSNFLDCPVAGYEGQDGDWGRDAAARDVGLVKSGDGVAGFDFTKVGSDGQDLPSDAASWACVRDNHTGLTWEVKANDGGLHDRDWTYSWYNPDAASNGGNAGTAAGGNCGGTVPDGCDTEKFVAEINLQGLCGHHDWQLPSAEQLQSISHLGAYPGVPLDADYFPNELGYWAHWSADPVGWEASYAYSYNQQWGGIQWNAKSGLLNARLVRRPDAGE
jgi:hypothetical protein